MVARVKWEKFSAIFCNISTKGKRLEVKACPYIPTLQKRFGAGSSGGNVLVPARTLRRSRLRGRCRKAAPLRTPRPHRRKQIRMFRLATSESVEKSPKDTVSLEWQDGANYFRAVTGICKFFLYFSIFRLFPLHVTGFSVIIPGSMLFSAKHTKTFERI